MSVLTDSPHFWTIANERARVVVEARKWIRTPFHHGQRLVGVGVDCANLLIAVYTAACVVDKYEPGYYAPDWFLHESLPRIEVALERDFVRVDALRHGDIATFEYGRAVSHVGIVTLWPSIVHADRKTGMVLEDRAETHSELTARFAGGWTLRRWLDK